MAVPVDIACPSCGRTRPVEKRALDRYRCTGCQTAFGPEDVRPD